MIIDANNLILGRLGAFVAKQALLGESIDIVNCEKAIISGKKADVLGKYKQRRARGEPYHGPFYPRNPKGIVKRTIRGMLPYKKTQGRAALKRLKIWIGVPEELKKQELIKLESSDVNKLKCKHITVEELSLWLGTKKRW